MSIGDSYTTEHCLGLFYSQSTTPFLHLTSLEEMCVIEGALPGIVTPGDLGARIWRSARPELRVAVPILIIKGRPIHTCG